MCGGRPRASSKACKRPISLSSVSSPVPEDVPEEDGLPPAPADAPALPIPPPEASVGSMAEVETVIILSPEEDPAAEEPGSGIVGLLFDCASDVEAVSMADDAWWEPDLLLNREERLREEAEPDALVPAEEAPLADEDDADVDPVVTPGLGPGWRSLLLDTIEPILEPLCLDLFLELKSFEPNSTLAAVALDSLGLVKSIAGGCVSTLTDGLESSTRVLFGGDSFDASCEDDLLGFSLLWLSFNPGE